MDITRRQSKLITFGDIADNSCFEYNNDVYFKVRPFTYTAITGATGEISKVDLNAVNLHDAYITTFDDTIAVKPVKMRIEEVV